MACSEAQLLANKANSLKSKGPSSPEGRRISSLNSTKHGLTGQGIVVAEDVAEEVELRVGALQAEMKPTTSAGAMLLRKIAFFSVRSELAADHENATIARNVRHAADDFDEARIDQARALLGGLADDPRHVLRKLKKRPEGIDVLIEAWCDLRDDLASDPEPVWGEAKNNSPGRPTCSASASGTRELRDWVPSPEASGVTSRAWRTPTAASTARSSGGSGLTSP